MKPTFRALIPVVLAAFALFGLAACAHVDPGLVHPTKVYRDAPVEKSRLAVSVKPRSRLYESPQVLMYPFWIAQKMDNHLLVGREMARLVHQTWTGDGVFEAIMYDPQLVYRGPEQAVNVARNAGADLVIVGVVPYLYTGGSIDSTSVSLQIRVYETRSGNLVLSMEQSARVNARLTQDWILFDLHTRLSDSPLSEALASLARDMAVPLRSWLPPSDEELGFADTSQAMTRNLLASGVPLVAGSPLAGGEDSDASREMVAGLLESAGSGGTGGKGGKGANNSLKLKVEFDVDSARIREQSYGLLDELAKALRSEALRGRRVVISGHADSDHTREYNQKLSERRAAAVKAHLAERGGVAAESLRSEGFGETRPLVPNTSAANKQRNRRVEVRLDR